MVTIALHAIKDATRLVRHLTINAVKNQLSVSKNGIERRAQLMTHIGEELRLVPAGLFKLSALVLELVKQPRILDGQHGLRGKGLQQLHRALREFARFPAAHYQCADGSICAEQRHRHMAAEAGTENDIEHGR